MEQGIGNNGEEIELEPVVAFENAPFDKEREIRKKDLKIGHFKTLS